MWYIGYFQKFQILKQGETTNYIREFPQDVLIVPKERY